jgi:hypothetical protein
MINGINNPVHKVMDLDVGYQNAYKVLARSSFDRFLMQSLYDSCEANIDQAKLEDCLTTNQSIMNGRLNGRFSSLSSSKSEITTAITQWDVDDQTASIQN